MLEAFPFDGAPKYLLRDRDRIFALGMDAGTIDGIAGKRTGTVVSHFRQQHGLASSEVVDDALIASLLQQLDQPLTAVSQG
jgi:peptidoglycan hydrolase-like protein with peptidoglycan-binding domain